MLFILWTQTLKTLFFKILLFINIIAISYLATTTQEIEILQNNWDKANHFVAFSVLYILLSFAFKHFALSFKVTLLLLFASSIEIIQSFIPNREFLLLDIIAGFIGIIFGMIFMKILRYFRIFTIDSKSNEN